MEASTIDIAKVVSDFRDGLTWWEEWSFAAWRLWLSDADVADVAVVADIAIAEFRRSSLPADEVVAISIIASHRIKDETLSERFDEAIYCHAKVVLSEAVFDVSHSFELLEMSNETLLSRSLHVSVRPEVVDQRLQGSWLRFASKRQAMSFAHKYAKVHHENMLTDSMVNMLVSIGGEEYLATILGRKVRVTSKTFFRALTSPIHKVSQRALSFSSDATDEDWSDIIFDINDDEVLAVALSHPDCPDHIRAFIAMS